MISTGEMSYEILNPLDYADWDDLVRSHPDSTLFHSTYWARVLFDTYRYKPVYVGSVQAGQLQWLIPMMEIKSILTGARGVSLPFSDYCEPLVSARGDVDEAFKGLVDLGRSARWKYFELRCSESMPEEWACYSRYYRHTLALSEDSEKVYSGFQNTVKRNIRKSLKGGVKVKRHKTESSMRSYYRLHCLTRKRQGLPPQPYRFFHYIFEHIVARDMGFVILAEFEGVPIAGGVFFSYRDKAMFKYGASDYSYQNLRANDLVMWKAIEWFCQNGFRRFCFGRTQIDHEGLRHFKLGWGCEETLLKYYKYSMAEGQFVEKQGLEKPGYAVFRKMPIFMLRILGSILYRHVG